MVNDIKIQMAKLWISIQECLERLVLAEKIIGIGVENQSGITDLEMNVPLLILQAKTISLPIDQI